MTRPLWRMLWTSRRAAAFDFALVLLLVVVALVLGFFFPTRPSPNDDAWVGVTTVVEGAVGLGLLVRRRFPVALMAFLTAVAVVEASLFEFTGGPMLSINLRTNPWIPVITPLVIYTVAIYATGRARQITGWCLVGLVTILAVGPWTRPDAQVIINGLVSTALPALMGLYVGARRRLFQEWRDRAVRAEREQHLLAERARAEERARLASEMHDVVTHRLSLMVLQAGALGITARDDATRGAAEELRAAGCEALEELRDLVGVLRSGPAVDGGRGNPDKSGAPNLSDLVTASHSAGVVVDLKEEGNSALVSPTVGRTAYRVVQEALTNVNKHAQGALVAVRAHYGTSQVRLTIHNTAPPGSGTSDLAGSGSGTGLHGLRQRVELVGGTLSAGATPDGGFEVNAILPAFVPTGGAVDEFHDEGDRRRRRADGVRASPYDSGVGG